MKHTLKITITLLAMFFVTQLIALAVVHSYAPVTQTILNQTTGIYETVTVQNPLPIGQMPEMNPLSALINILIAMVIAVFLILLLMKIKAEFIFKIWFFFVVVVALSITLNSINSYYNISMYFIITVALIFGFLKVFRRNIIVHNLTELLIYPGIAAVFVPILNIPATIIFLLVLSVYDIYAVWHAGFMQKMAKYQIQKVGVFSGFFVPYLGSKEREKVELLKQKYKNKIPDSVIKNKKIKVNLAILGGGDVVFPAILSGVVFLEYGLIPALIITVFATLALLYLFISAKKGKFYPAMPFITVGCLIGLAVSLLI